ncbi:MAG: hypothetical protein WEA04_03755 [Candidatus Andersenbacteria bacterium]
MSQSHTSKGFSVGLIALLVMIVGVMIFGAVAVLGTLMIPDALAAGCLAIGGPSPDDYTTYVEQGKIKFGFNGSSATFINNSPCAIIIRHASYKIFADNHQELFDATDRVVVNPGETRHFSVTVPTCDYQIDLEPYWNIQFNSRGESVVHGIIVAHPNGRCQVTPTPTPTPTVQPSPTPTPTVEPTPTPETPSKDKDLTVSKTDHRDVTRPGHSVTYAITIHNTGEVDLHDVKVVDTVPGKLHITTMSDSGKRIGSTITWSGLSLNAGEQKQVSFTATVAHDAAHNHLLVNKVVVTSSDHGLEASAHDNTLVLRQVQVKGVQRVTSVPVTARTGAGLVGLLTTLVGATGLTVIARRVR